MNPLVSLVMPVRLTRPEWLLEAVRSALDEHAVPIELVVVDDASSEPVERLLAPIDDSRLRVIRVAEAGPYGARNAGLASASGDWVRFVDSDDVVGSGSTGQLFRATAGERVIPYGATLVCDEQLAPERLIVSTVEGSAHVECVLGRFEVRVVSMLFPRDIVEAAGPWDPTFRVSGDWDFVLRALELAPVRPVDMIATRYRRHLASVTRTADVAAGERARERIVAGYFERHAALRGGRVWREVRLNLLLDTAAAYAHHFERRAALVRLARAARIRPAAAAAAATRILPRLVWRERSG